jgi:hypothetical protein
MPAFDSKAGLFGQHRLGIGGRVATELKRAQIEAKR